MLNILFWNLNKNPIDAFVTECLVENDIDIAIFSEYEATNFEKITSDIGVFYNRIQLVQENQTNQKVTLLANKSFSVDLIRSQHRYNIYSIKTLTKNYLLAAIHLEDRRNYKSADRIETIKELVSDIVKEEKIFKCCNTIIIGDFNANPYDEELLSKYAFNAVLFKKVIKISEFTNPRTDMIKRFYNPILHYLSETTEMYGSFYYARDHMTSYWNCLDQVLVRKDLADNIKHMEYLKGIGDKCLLKNEIPDSSISDHLPLLVTLQEVDGEV